MDTKKLLSLLALIGGEAIIITSFILWRGLLSNELVTMNIVVSSVIYLLFFVDILFPWVDLKDKSHKAIGSIGVRWFCVWIYSVVAIAVMVCCNVIVQCSFASQLIIHSILFVLLILGLVAVLHAKDKVGEVATAQAKLFRGTDEMKRAVVQISERAELTGNLPQEVVSLIKALADDVRFISPSNNPEAAATEQEFIAIINNVSVSLAQYELDKDGVYAKLKEAQIICKKRKSIYSN